MLIQLIAATPEQLAAIRNNFDTVVIAPSDDEGKYDVGVELNTPADAWRLFYSGADYCLAKMGKHVKS
jgi:hypothetical protein